MFVFVFWFFRWDGITKKRLHTHYKYSRVCVFSNTKLWRSVVNCPAHKKEPPQSVRGRLNQQQGTGGGAVVVVDERARNPSNTHTYARSVLLLYVHKEPPAQANSHGRPWCHWGCLDWVLEVKREMGRKEREKYPSVFVSKIRQ